MSDCKRILLIVADQYRSELMSCRGHALIKTPHLDALANNGVLFKNFFSVTAPCGPSRMCLFSGRYLCSTRSVHNMTPFEDANENVAQYLTDAGVQSYFMGYNDYAYDQRILEDGHPKKGVVSYDNVLPGFETLLYHEYDSQEYFDNLREKGYPEHLLNGQAIHAPNIPESGCDGHIERSFPAHYKTEDSECRFLTEQAVDFFQKHKDDDSWFLSLNYIKPHPPHICSDPYHKMYNPQQLAAAIRQDSELDPEHPYLRAIKPSSLVNEQEQRELNAIYYGMISELDESIGVLIEGMKTAGVWDDTLVVFTSDHGEYMGDHYLHDKGHFYDQSMHIPCIIRDPLAPEQHGKQISGFAESIDVCPSILDYAGQTVPNHIQGQSLRAVVNGVCDNTTKEEIYHEYDYMGKVCTEVTDDDIHKHLLWVIRDHKWKYVQFSDDKMPALLFNLEDDPQEFNNLADCPDYQAQQLAYCQKLLRWRMRNEDRRMEYQKLHTGKE